MHGSLRDDVESMKCYTNTITYQPARQLFLMHGSLRDDVESMKCYANTITYQPARQVFLMHGSLRDDVESFLSFPLRKSKMMKLNAFLFCTHQSMKWENNDGRILGNEYPAVQAKKCSKQSILVSKLRNLANKAF